jgi:two-component system response regulator HydG
LNVAINKNRTILVVDDDFSHRTMLETLLTRWGYEVSEADDGQSAIDMVHEKPFDLILMDIRMVKVSGLTALSAIKEINPSIPVIIMTAYSSIDTAINAIKKGAYDTLPNPWILMNCT